MPVTGEAMKKLESEMVAILLAMMLMSTCQASNALHPLILVPGSGGNQLEARLTSDYKSTGLLCNRWYPIRKEKGGWFRLWFDPTVLLNPFTRCFAQRMMLHYDLDVDDYRNAAGVETRVTHFGSTASLLYLNPLLKQVTGYMAYLIDSLKQIGYMDGRTLFGAPYDFRYGLAAEGHPSHVGSKFLEDLKNLIEEASTSNGGRPVILLSHSLGGLYVLQLLNRYPSSWRRKFIKHFVALSTPWGGTVDEMRTFASGSTFGVPLVDPLLVRGEQRSAESNLWMMPNPEIFDHQKPLVITENANYTVHDIATFLHDIGFGEGVHPYKTRILPLIKKIEAPEVPVTCIVGTGVPTPETLFYRNSDFDEQPEIVHGDGDGTVNMASLLALESLWSGNENQTLKVIRIRGVSHTAILKQESALDQIVAVISDINHGTCQNLFEF